MKNIVRLTSTGSALTGLPVGGDVWLGPKTLAAVTTVPRLTKTGGGLQLGGQPFRFAGTNIYWLALNDNATGGTGTFVSNTDIRLALDQAVAMGATVVRVHTLGISVGKTNTMMPTVGTWNDAAVERADFVVSEAGKRGLKLMVPTTDRWDYYHGGGLTLAKLVLGSSATISDFYTNTSVRTAHKAYLSTLLNHVNRYTGLRWGADPTLAIWETGNELYDAPTIWHNDITATLKALAPLALVADGSAASGMHVSNAPGLNDTNTDILGGHFYPRDSSWLATDAAAAVAAGKAYIVGEYDWTDGDNNGDYATANGGATKPTPAVLRSAWLSAIEGNTNVSGDLFWSLEVDKATVGTHRDGYELYGDAPENSEQSAGRAALAAHAATMTASTVVTVTIPGNAQTAPVSAFAITGAWQTGSSGEIYTHDTTATANLTFTGTYLELLAVTDTYHTSINVQIDSGAVTNVPESSSARNTSASVFKVAGLTSGTHTLKITVAAASSPTVTVIAAHVAGYTSANSTGGTGAPPATTTPVTGFVTRNTSTLGLSLNGKAYKYVGFNAVNMLGPTNATRQVTDDAAYYKNVAFGMTDRVWALPGCDYAHLDRIVQAAKANGSRLIITLFDALGSTGPNWSTLNSNFGSYQGHLSTVVTTYKNEPTILGWELANEPPQDRTGFDRIAGAIKAIDSVHLVSTGTSAIYSDGDVAGYQNAGASSYVDILSMHEYDSLQTQSSHLARILPVAVNLNKPIILGEVGIDANVGGTGTGGTAPNGVTTFTGRATLIGQKTDAYLAHAEVCGFNYWSVGQNSIGSQADSYMALGETAGISAMKAASAKWSKNGN